MQNASKTCPWKCGGGQGGGGGSGGGGVIQDATNTGLLFLLRNSNWSMVLLLLQSLQRKSGACSMVAEGHVGFKTDIGQAELECHVCAAVSATIRSFDMY